MKKFLSVLLAVMMVLPTIAIAAPSAVTDIDTAVENTNETNELEAELNADSFYTYDIRYFAFGNSYLKYDYSTTAHVDWWMRNSVGGIEDPRGMAASESSKDYFHQIQSGVKESLGEQGHEVLFTSEALSIAGPEQSWIYSGLNGDYANYDYTLGAASVDAAWAEPIATLAAYQPNVVTLQMGENTGLSAANACRPIAAWFYDRIVGKIREAAPDAIIVVLTVFEPGVVTNGIKDAFEQSQYTNFKESNRVFLSDNSDMVIPTWMIGNASYPQYNNLKDQLGTTSNSLGIVDYRYNHPYLAYKQYPEFDAVKLADPSITDFRGHPGDEGMAEIGRRAAAVLTEQIPNYIDGVETIIPTSLGAIKHDRHKDENGVPYIEAVGGKAELYLDSITPSDASKKVVWSVDNEEIATVEVRANGCYLWAKRNGEVTVTVASAFNPEVNATQKFIIKGQAAHFTISYNLNADDATGLPSSYAYAAGDYVFPSSTYTPKRVGYKFAGWSETKDGTAVDSVFMNENKTVYAVWEFADNWQFNKDGYIEGIESTGMHGKTEGGYFSAQTYESGAANISAKDLRLDSDNYRLFKTKMSISEVQSGDKMVLEINTLEGDKFTYETNLAYGMTEYTFDISTVTGTISSFTVGSSNGSIATNNIKVDYAEFVKDIQYNDREIENYTVSGVEVYTADDYKYTFTNLTIASDATLQLNAGNYVINGLTNNGTIIASPNANVLFGSGTTIPDGYVKIEIGTKKNTVRYAEVDGMQYKISEASGNTTYGMIVGDTDKLLQIQDGTNTRYYFVDASAKSATELEGLKGFMHKTNAKYDFGTDGGKYGAKFESYVVDAAKAETASYNIFEYGYIVSLDALVGVSNQLNFGLDASKYAYGAAYAKGVSDKVVDSTDTSLAEGSTAFRAVIYGAPETGYGKKLVVKTYTKLVVNDQEFIVYGEPQYESFYSLAQTLKEAGVTSDVADTIISATKDNATDGPTLDFGDLLG